MKLNEKLVNYLVIKLNREPILVIFQIVVDYKSANL